MSETLTPGLSVSLGLSDPVPKFHRGVVMRRGKRGFAQVKEHIGQHVSREELLDGFADGDVRFAMTSFDGLELEGVSTNGTSFDQVIFRSCLFEDVDFSDASFTDVRFEAWRFISCTMERCWLNRCDFAGCSAPGMSFAKGRLTSVFFGDCQLGYADFSETKIQGLVAESTSLVESAWRDVRLKAAHFDACDLARAEFMGTSLAGIDLSTCEISGLVVSSTLHELRGCTVSPLQAIALAGYLGVQVK